MTCSLIGVHDFFYTLSTLTHLNVFLAYWKDNRTQTFTDTSPFRWETKVAKLTNLYPRLSLSFAFLVAEWAKERAWNLGWKFNSAHKCVTT